jgi:hypothetical protein
MCSGGGLRWPAVASLGLGLFAHCRPAQKTALPPQEVRAPVATVPAWDNQAQAGSARRRPLGPAADSVRRYLVFVPLLDRWFVGAAPNGRLGVDLGRVDLDLRRSAHLLAAFREAAAARSPVPLGSRLLVRTPERAFYATIASFEEWQGRIVGLLQPSFGFDRLPSDSVVASVERARQEDTSPRERDTSPTDSCQRDVGDEMEERAGGVADSLLALLRSRRPANRSPSTLVARKSYVLGCFTGGRAIVAASLAARDYSWYREQVVLIGEDGRVRELLVHDFRFRVHELLIAFDADGDGSDDVAARAWTEREGGTVVLRLAAGQLERLAAGFSWEEWR